jgi:ABC-type lipoprotein export system ATPase subunit
MLQTYDLQFSYAGATPSSFAFPDLQATSGDPLLILGQSGVGKTTLLHLLAGILRPQRGQILIGETDIAQLSIRDMDRFRGQYIGIVFQQAHFVQALTVGRNLQLAQYLAGSRPDRQRIDELLGRLGLTHKLDQSAQRLSLGEQQRVSIARAVLNRPQLLLADEPTSALDDQNTAEVIDLLSDTAKQAGAALVIVTHDQRLKDRFSNRVPLIAGQE